MKIIRNSYVARGRAPDISVSVGLCPVRQSVAFMVGGVRVRERVRERPALPRRNESAGAKGGSENYGMDQLNLEPPAQQFI